MFFVSLLFVLLVGVQGQLLFNSSYNCTQGCSILNPAIYIGNTLPTATQQVIFNVTGDEEFLYIPANSSYQVASLQMSCVGAKNSAVIFEIGDNVQLNVVDELTFSRVFLQVNTTGKLIVQNSAYFENGDIFSDGLINIGSAKFSNIYLDSSSTSIFNRFDFENGRLTVTGSFNSSSSVILSSSVFFYRFLAPHLGNVYFDSVDANFGYGFYVDGQYTISSSNFSGVFLAAIANVPLVLSGKNHIAVDEIHLNKVTINNTVPSYTTFQLYEASFSGNLSIPGEIQAVRSYTEINCTGNIEFSGGLQVNSGWGAKIRTTGSLSFGGPVLLNGEISYNSFSANSFIVDNSIFSTPSISVQNFVVDLRAGSISVNNSLSNNGSVHIFEPSSVIVQGDYTQLLNATLAVFNLSSALASHTSLMVTGTAYVGGDIRYNTSETKNQFTANVIHAHAIQGSFATSQFYDQDYEYGNKNKLKATLQYNADSVQILIKPTGSASQIGKGWWVYFLGTAIVFVM